MPKTTVEKLVKISEQQKAVACLKFSDHNGNLEECTLPDDSNVAGVHDDVFIKTEDVDVSVFDEAEEAEPQANHRSGGNSVEVVEEKTVPAPEESTVKEPMVETAQEDDDPEPEHENPPELETAQDEPEEEEEVDPTKELEDINEAPEELFDTPR